MATLKNNTVSRFHNLTDEALADAIGRADAIVKAAESELAALKDEFKARGLAEVAGDDFTVTATDAVSWRLDTKAVRAFLGAKASKFETVSNTTTIRIKAANRLALAAGSEAAAGQRSCRHSPHKPGRAVALSPTIEGLSHVETHRFRGRRSYASLRPRK